MTEREKLQEARIAALEKQFADLWREVVAHKSLLQQIQALQPADIVNAGLNEILWERFLRGVPR